MAVWAAGAAATTGPLGAGAARSSDRLARSSPAWAATAARCSWTLSASNAAW